MSSSTPWGVRNKQTGLWWTGGLDATDEDPWTATPTPAGDSKKAARAAFSAMNGAFPTSRVETAQLPAVPATPGGVTANTPGMTDRVAGILAKTNGAQAGAEAEVPETDPGTEVAVPTDTTPAVSTAEEMDRTIRAQAATVEYGFAGLLELLEEAQARDLHTELGFASWPLYVADVVSTEMPTLGRQPALRQEVTRLMLEAGMSQGAIAAAQNVNQATVSRDAAKIQTENPVMQPRMTDPVDAEVIDYPWVLQNDNTADYWGGDSRTDWGTADCAAAYSSAKQVRLAWTKVTGVQRIPKGYSVLQLSDDDLFGEPMPEVLPDVAETITTVGKDGKEQTRVKPEPKAPEPKPEPAAPAAPPKSTFANVMNRLTALIEAAEEVADMVSDLEFSEGTATYKGETYDGAEQYDMVHDHATDLYNAAQYVLDAADGAR